MNIYRIFSLIFLLTLFYFLYGIINWNILLLSLLNADLIYLLPSVLISFFLPFLSTLRWQKVLCALGYRPKIKELIKIVFFSFSLNLITPAKSGDLVKILAHKNIKNKSKLISGVILDRLSDLLVLSLLCLIWGLYLKNYIGIYLGLSILISLIFLIFIKKFIKINFKIKLIKKIFIIFNKSFELLLNKSKYILLLIFLSFLQWFLVSFQVFFLFISFGANIPIIIIFSLFPVVVIASVLLP